ncbi:MAG TPA: aldehyde dehydrogenase family protein [Spirillospora sp.]
MTATTLSADLAARISTARLPARHTFLDGRLVDGTGDPMTTLYPGDGSTLAQVSATAPSLIEEAVGGAVRAQPAWAATPPLERAAVLRRAADLLEASVDRLAHLVVLDNGKTWAEGRADVMVAAALLRSSASWATNLEGSTLPLDGTAWKMTFREPVGVVAAIIPFNAPLMFSAQKAGPALAAGNAIVLKAPEQSPLAPPVFAELMTEAGLPAGALQVVQGEAPAGQALLQDRRVDLISFTGSSAVGRQVMAAAAAGPTRLLLELGGKSANIVFADADLEAALDGSLAGIFRNAGQRCFSGSRLLVQDAVADEFIAELASRAARIPVGDPFDQRNRVGALISRQEVTRVRGMVDQATRTGARLVTGGDRPPGVHPGGAFLQPTIVEVPADRAADVDLVCEEVFGPVLAVQRFGDDAEAVRLANDSSYGLAGGCWTRDIARAVETARAIRTGYFWINSYGALALDAPVGGYKSSGFGRELGRAGHEEYTELKTVILESAPERRPPWLPADATRDGGSR